MAHRKKNGYRKVKHYARTGLKYARVGARYGVKGVKLAGRGLREVGAGVVVLHGAAHKFRETQAEYQNELLRRDIKRLQLQAQRHRLRAQVEAAKSATKRLRGPRSPFDFSDIFER